MTAQSFALPRSFRAQDARFAELLTLRGMRGLTLPERELAGEIRVGQATRLAAKERRLATAQAALERTMSTAKAFTAPGHDGREASPSPFPPPDGDALVFPALAQRRNATAPGPIHLNRAMRDVARLRHEQATIHGHTAEADDARDLQDFARLQRQFAKDVHEDIQFNNRDLARRHAIKLAALALALADRLDRDAARFGDLV